MIVIPREICLDIEDAIQHEWLIRNSTGSSASATITGACTRRQHGLLVTPLNGEQIVTLAKIDEELEVERQVYRLGTNEYLTHVINPDGFLYLQQVSYDGVLVNFVYEAGRFQLTKTIWIAETHATTYIRYTLADYSAPVRLTLLPLCDYRTTERFTQGSEDWHFQIEQLAEGISVTARPGATPYRILTEPRARFTPLDLWYWRFQLRAENDAGLDLYVPGLFRLDLAPGASFTLIATCEADGAASLDVERAYADALERQGAHPLPATDPAASSAAASPQ